MKRNTIFGILAVAIVGITIYNFATTGESGAEYQARVEEDREIKNRYMRSGSSPMLEEDKAEFTGLNFFPINSDYKIRAKLDILKRKQPIFIATTTGEQREYLRFGYAEFELNGQSHKLILYKDLEENNPRKLSLMFADETSGLTTYGGGRYLDVYKDSDMAITIDFNFSYNPYCHFNEEYSCPLPPRENLMTVAVEAGEKLYKAL